MNIFCPGPINIKENIKNMKIKEHTHRCDHFHELYDNCVKETKKLFNINDNYQILFLTGSGTLSIESMIYSYIKNKKILLLQNGHFSERWEKMLKHYKTNYDKINFEWNNEFNYTTIRKKLSGKKYDGIFVVHQETSTTMINDINKLNHICEEFNLELYLDSVSTAGMYDIDLNVLKNITMMGYSSNKAIGIYPGLAINIVKNKVLKELNDEMCYLNLGLYYKYSLKKETPFTCCYQNLQYYCFSLQLINEDTNRFLYYKNLMDYLIEKMKERNIYPVLKKGQCNWVINFTYNEPDLLCKKLEKQGILIYKCKGVLKNKTIQIAILNKKKEDIDNLLKSI